MRKYFIVFLLIVSNLAMAQQKELPLKGVLYGMFRQKSVYGIVSMKNGTSYTCLEDNSIVKYSYATGEKEEVVVDFKKLGISYVEDYQFSANEDKILFYTSSTPIYRRSFKADYYVYDLRTQKFESLTDERFAEADKAQLATLSPDSKKVAFVVNRNIYVKDLESGETKQITTDGQMNTILNGLPDWVYEEEFEFNQAFEFSPDSKYLAYIKFDETNVKSYTLQYYHKMTEDYVPEANYPINYEYKYPKAGEANSIVSVHICNLESGETKPADLGSETDIYVPKIQWIANTGDLAISRLNRLQNHLELLRYNPASGSTTKFFDMKDKRYIEESVMPNVIYLNDGKSFLIQSEKDGYRNICHYSTDGKLINNVTSGSQEIEEIIGYDEKTKKVYFTANGENSTQVAIYSVDISGKNRTKLSAQNGTNRAEFSSNFKYFINFFSNASTPYYITVNDSKGKLVRVIEDNAALKQKIEEFGGTNKEFFTWKNESGESLNAYMIKPADFDENKQYPVLVVGYNGPNHNMVNDAFEFNWQQVLARKGYIVACTDTRGTGRKGAEFRKCTYGQLGNLETQDLVAFSKYLGSQKFIDGSRLGIWGWSYGGFMASNVMTRGAGNYKLGIAVAPVENWEYYDNIYTERYMGLPQQNASGYKDNSPLKYADKLQGKFLLIYGSADDNVHPQNSMVFCEALVQADKDFEFMQYTNKNHGIYGGNTTFHLYKKMLNFIENNL